jgi:transcription elongation factor Elf1
MHGNEIIDNPKLILLCSIRKTALKYAANCNNTELVCGINITSYVKPVESAFFALVGIVAAIGSVT